MNTHKSAPPPFSFFFFYFLFFSSSSSTFYHKTPAPHQISSAFHGQPRYLTQSKSPRLEFWALFQPSPRLAFRPCLHLQFAISYYLWPFWKVMRSKIQWTRTDIKTGVMWWQGKEIWVFYQSRLQAEKSFKRPWKKKKRLYIKSGYRWEGPNLCLAALFYLSFRCQSIPGTGQGAQMLFQRCTWFCHRTPRQKQSHPKSEIKRNAQGKRQEICLKHLQWGKKNTLEDDFCLT